MPEIDGLAATKTIREIKYKRPIIGYTAYSHSNDVQTCLDVGMNIVLNKPTVPDQILSTVDKLIN